MVNLTKKKKISKKFSKKQNVKRRCKSLKHRGGSNSTIPSSNSTIPNVNSNSINYRSPFNKQLPLYKASPYKNVIPTYSSGSSGSSSYLNFNPDSNSGTSKINYSVPSTKSPYSNSSLSDGYQVLGTVTVPKTGHYVDMTIGSKVPKGRRFETIAKALTLLTPTGKLPSNSYIKRYQNLSTPPTNLLNKTPNTKSIN